MRQVELQMMAAGIVQICTSWFFSVLVGSGVGFVLDEVVGWSLFVCILLGVIALIVWRMVGYILVSKLIGGGGPNFGYRRPKPFGEAESRSEFERRYERRNIAHPGIEQICTSWFFSVLVGSGVGFVLDEVVGWSLFVCILLGVIALIVWRMVGYILVSKLIG